MTIKLTKSNFQKEVTNSDKPVLIDFYADWCGPCKMAARFVDELAEEYADKVKVCKVNVDEEMEIAQSYKVSSIPTFVMIKDSNVISRKTGFSGKKGLEDMIEA